MSPSGPPPAPSRNGVSTEEAAADLYRHSPATFARRRDALAAALQETGDELGAARIRRLPVPTMAAWWVNQLAQRWPIELAALLDLGPRLRAAAQERDTERLAEIDRTRRVRTDSLLSLLWHHGAQEEIVADAPPEPAEAAEAAEATALGDPWADRSPVQGPTRHVQPTHDDLTLVLEAVTAAVLDDELAEVVRAGRLAQAVVATDVDLLHASAEEAMVPVTAPRRELQEEAGTLAVATAAVVDAENRVAAASDTVAALTSMLDGLEQELAELTRARASTEARLETWRRTALEAERDLQAARSRLARLT